MIDTNLTLFHNEIFGVMVNPSVALQSLHHQKQIVGIGDIFDLAEPTVHMLDVNLGDISLSAELLLVFEDDVSGVDYV